MKHFYFIFSIVLLVSNFSFGQTTIYTQDFETTPATPELTYTTSSSVTITNNTTGIEEHEESRENVLTDWYLSEETYNVPSDEPLRAGERKESSNSLINLSKDMGESKPSDTPDVYKREAELTTCDAGNVSNEQSLFSSGDENQDYDVSDNKYLRPGDIIEYRPQSVNHCDLRDNLVLATVTEIIMDEDEVEVKLDDFTTLYGLHGLRRVAKMCNDGKIMMDKSRWHFVNEFNLGCTSLFPSFVPPRKKLFMPYFCFLESTQKILNLEK